MPNISISKNAKHKSIPVTPIELYAPNLISIYLWESEIPPIIFKIAHAQNLCPTQTETFSKNSQIVSRTSQTV